MQPAVSRQKLPRRHNARLMASIPFMQRRCNRGSKVSTPFVQWPADPSASPVLLFRSPSPSLDERFRRKGNDASSEEIVSPESAAGSAESFTGQIDGRSRNLSQLSRHLGIWPQNHD